MLVSYHVVSICQFLGFFFFFLLFSFPSLLFPTVLRVILYIPLFPGFQFLPKPVSFAGDMEINVIFPFKSFSSGADL